jgi:hypothetical protein
MLGGSVAGARRGTNDSLITGSRDTWTKSEREGMGSGDVKERTSENVACGEKKGRPEELREKKTVGMGAKAFFAS